MNAVEIFTGAGGLAIALTKAGITHKVLIERDKDSCNTLRNNLKYLQNGHETPLELYEGDARTYDYKAINSKIDIVAGGPPCQPFSLGGKHRGYNDNRDMFPEAVRAVRELKPKAFIFENVRGLTRKSFLDYFEYILLQLTHPYLCKKDDEKWVDHKKRLVKCHDSASEDGITYQVNYRVLNAANYGVPQRRERVFFVGFRKDLEYKWAFPESTHSYMALLKSKWITKDYWKKHNIPLVNKGKPGNLSLSKIANDMFVDDKLPWMTIRDAIGDLPDPLKKNDFPNHEYRGGAKQYKGHTGSFLDEASKTIKAGVHGVPGGENMNLLPDGNRRYFTAREAARIQTFPDEYIFASSWTESMRQIGNAVPVLLGEVVARSVLKALERNEQTNTLQSA